MSFVMHKVRWATQHQIEGWDPVDGLDAVLPILPSGLDRNARTIIETYCALRLCNGATTEDILEEHPLKASIEIKIYIAGFDPAHRQRFERGHVPSSIANFTERCLRAFYTALAAAELRTAGDPFTALAQYAAEEAPG